MAKLTVEISDHMMEWLSSHLEQGDGMSADMVFRRLLREEREKHEPDYRYSDDDIQDMLEEGLASGLAPKQSVDEIFAEVTRAMEQRRNRVA